MDGISRSRGWDKEIPHGVLPMEQLVLGDKWARKCFLFPKFESKTWTMLYVFDGTSTNILEITLRVVAHIFRYVEEKRKISRP